MSGVGGVQTAANRNFYDVMTCYVIIRQDILMVVSIIGNVTNAGLTVSMKTGFFWPDNENAHLYFLIIYLLDTCTTSTQVFTMTVLDEYTVMFRMWFFVLFQWFCFATQVSNVFRAVLYEPQQKQ